MIGRNFRVILRTQSPGTDLPLVRNLLASGNRSLILRQYEHEDEAAGLEFSNNPSLASFDEVRTWQQPAFRNLTEWLRSKAPDEFRPLREAEISVDVAILDYHGQVPVKLLEQLARLQISLFILPVIPIDL